MSFEKELKHFQGLCQTDNYASFYYLLHNRSFLHLPGHWIILVLPIATLIHFPICLAGDIFSLVFGVIYVMLLYLRSVNLFTVIFNVLVGWLNVQLGLDSIFFTHISNDGRVCCLHLSAAGWEFHWALRWRVTLLANFVTYIHCNWTEVAIDFTFFCLEHDDIFTRHIDYFF